ncbi:MAG TPA: sigma 54-interacting transcriptional regulator [Vicinamibacterales bacterium]|nr:sigma 54-interacting transcriptional regulator [Vicinamibacterales bacterium]
MRLDRSLSSLPTGTVSSRASEPATSDRAIVGTSDVLKYVMYRVEQVASTNASVLLLGETGTGKELVARAIHNQSRRAHRKFMVVNCSALPPTLIESELFGRDRGAFTGAHTSQPGRFELADGGTIFLDEIGELPLELQPKLLRVLQEGQFERLGSTRTVDVDVRIVAATNRNLVEDVNSGKFRQDLFYRLNVFPITLPALRERLEDLPALLRHFSDRVGRQMGRTISRVTPGTLEALRQYDWPGNIREFENVIQQAVILSRDGVLDLSNFRGEPVRRSVVTTLSDEPQTLVEVQRAHILRMLQVANWRIEGPAGAAKVLGLCASTLRTRMRKLGIHRPVEGPQNLVTHPISQPARAIPFTKDLGAAAS